jgi:CheY-like chemotaxis protein
MNGILGFAQLLKEPHLSGTEQQSYIRIIEKSGTRMLNIINDIVDISRIESGHVEVFMTDTQVNDQLEFIQNFFRPEADHKKITLTLSPGLPPAEAVIRTDGEKLHAILTNLVKNALKYTPSGTIQIGYEKEKELLHFYVKDSGIGIAPDKHHTVFTRFLQGDHSVARSQEGAGLGLAIAKAYVELLGGKIWVESELGAGATFHFTIPCQAVTAKPPAKAQPASILNPSARSLKILVAEDDETSVEFLSNVLQKMKPEILFAGTGTEAVEKCRENPDLDLVLMDIRMPDMNGYEATRRIREFNREVIIIAQTAYALKGDRETALQAGCNEHITKPINPIHLRTLIGNLCR